MTSRLNEIGKQTPQELFKECIDLNGEMIKHVHGCNEKDFDAIIQDIYKAIENNIDFFSEYLISDFKLFLNSKVKMGVQTIGDHSEIEEMVKRGKKAEFAKQESKTEPKIVCGCCKELKLESEFRKVRGGVGVTKDCKSCVGSKISYAHNSKPKKDKPAEEKKPRNWEKEIEEVRRDNKLLNEKAEKYKKELEECQESAKISGEDFAKIDPGNAVYFVSGILKDSDTGQMSHVTGVYECKSKEEAIGAFVLQDNVKDEIIISIGYETNICDKDV